MSYIKTSWVDNVTPIDKDNLNKIEQGIYDNSLVVDAVTNTLNPTDTETYKTAELTEGQITDVIAVNDIIIKGQTSQDGKPTPSSPADVNVVSGSNVINTSNKNLFNPTYTFSEKGVTSVIINQQIKWNGTSSGGQTYKMADINMPIGTYKITLDVISGTHDNSKHIWLDFYNNNTKVANNNWFTSGIRTNTLNSSVNAIYLGFDPADTFNNFTFRMQIEKDAATTYEPHQGKELPLDLPVENLFDSSIITTKTANGITAKLENGEIVVTGTTTAGTVIYWEYTLDNSLLGQTLTLSYVGDFSNIGNIGFKKNGTDRVILTSGEKSKSFKVTQTLIDDVNQVSMWCAGSKTINARINIQLEQGSKANAYTPYGTTPIELCKIGNYQDYFYKSGSKWYLHKEIGKVVLDGTENWEARGTSTTLYQLAQTGIKPPTENNKKASLVSNFFETLAYYVNGTTDIFGNNNGISYPAIDNLLLIKNLSVNSLETFKAWLNEHNTKVYYTLATATNTEITDTTLISQLEAIYNAPLYEQTNITQTNNDLPMVLDITACKDNINGIKAFIRK